MSRALSTAIIVNLLPVFSVALGSFIQPFSLDEIKLHDGSLYHKAMSLNTEYMLSLEVDDLLLTFRQNAKLPSPGNPYVGSWEDPTCEVRGQFMGHYLSALAMLGNHTGQQEVLSRSVLIVQELKKVQDALGGGYLSAFPFEHFLRLRNLVGVWAPFYVIHKVMAGLLDQYLFLGNPLALQMVQDEAAYFLRYIDDVVATNGTQHWYNMLNNEFGGMNEVLINLYDITHNVEHLWAANMFIKPVFWQPLVQLQDPLPGIHANTHLAQVNGYAAKYDKVRDDSSMKVVSHFFDIVTGGHSFTTGGSNDHEFWGPPSRMGDSILQQAHATETQETCTQYNILKIARYLFRWTGAVAYADFYERAILNGLIGTQRMPSDYAPADSPPPRRRPMAISSTPRQMQAHSGPQVIDIDPVRENWRSAAFRAFPGTGYGIEGNQEESAGGTLWGAEAGTLQDTNDPGPGVLLYLMPQGTGQTKGQSSHGWGFPLRSFWCCYGTSVESFVKLADSIFFHRLPQAGDKGLPTVYINQWVPATLTARKLGVSIKMEADLYPSGFAATANLTLGPLGPGPVDLALALRVPSWAPGTRIWLNGQPWKSCDVESAGSARPNRTGEDQDDDEFGSPVPGTFCTVASKFKNGDVVSVELPLSVYTETVQDDRPEFAKFKSVMVGPHVMAALTLDTRSIAADPADVATLVTSIAPSEGPLVSLSASVTPDDDYLISEQGGDGHVTPSPDAAQAGLRLVPRGGSDASLRSDEAENETSLKSWKSGVLEKFNEPDNETSQGRGKSEDLGKISGGERLVMWHNGRELQVGGLGHRSKMLGTFRLMDQSVFERKYSGGRGPARGWESLAVDDVVMLESLDSPGFFVGGDDQDRMVLHNLHELGLSQSVESRCAFRLARCCVGPSAEPAEAASFCLQLYKGEKDPGPREHVHVAPRDPVTGGRRLLLLAEDPRKGGPAGPNRSLVPERCARGLAVRFEAPIGRYPAGAKVLTGKDRKYVIAPLSRVLEESYTTYLEWNPAATPLQNTGGAWLPQPS